MVTRSVNEGATAHAPSPIGAANNPPPPRSRVGLPSRGQRPRQPMVTRSVNEGATAHTPSPIGAANNPQPPRSRVGQPFRGQRPRQPMVTRSVNEGATAHAPSPIRNQPSNRYYLAHASDYHSVAKATSTNGNPKCQRGSYSTRSIAHRRGQ